MADKLLLDDQLITLGEDTKIGLTLQINDIGDISGRKGNLTNQFSLPKEQVNLKKLGQPQSVNSLSATPYRKTKAKYVSDGVEVIQNGFGIIEEAEKRINMTLYSGNANFFDLLKDDLISQIDLSDLTHVWNTYNIMQSFGNTQGYTYALIDFDGTMDINTWHVHIDKLLPSVFVRTLFERIHLQHGWSPAGTLLNDQRYKDLVVPCVADKIGHDQAWIDDKSFLAVKTGTQTVFGIAPLIVVFEDSWTLGYDNGSNYVNIIWNRYTPAEPILAKFKWSLNLRAPTATKDFAFQSSGQTISTGQVPGGTTVTVAFETAKKIWYPWEFIDLTWLPGTMNLASDLQILPGSTFTIEIDAQTEFNTDFDLALNLPKMKQKDFVKAIMNKFCVVPVPDDASQVMAYNFFSDVSVNEAKKKDWSNLIDLSPDRLPKVRYRIGSYSKRNNLVYTADSTTLPGLSDSSGDASFDVDDDTLGEESTIITSPFAVSQSKFWNNQYDHLLSIPKGASTGFNNKVKPRICYVERLPTTSIVLFDEILNTTSLGNVTLPFGRFRAASASTSTATTYGFQNGRLDFGKLLDDHYVEIRGILFRTKFVQAYFKLQAKHVQNFDHLIPVYIKYFGESFYVNKISNWKAKESSLVELVRLGGEVFYRPEAVQVVPVQNQDPCFGFHFSVHLGSWPTISSLIYDASSLTYPMSVNLANIAATVETDLKNALTTGGFTYSDVVVYKTMLSSGVDWLIDITIKNCNHELNRMTLSNGAFDDSQPYLCV